MRPGTFAIALLSTPINVGVIEALEEEPRNSSELRRALGAPSPTTVRKQLRLLSELEVVTRCQESKFPGSVSFELGPAAAELLAVSRVARDWLASAPEGSLSLGSEAAKWPLRALIEGWNSKIVRALAARPLSLTDLSRLISTLNYPALERRFSALHLSGLIEPRPAEGRSTPHGPTPWLRQAAGVLIAAAQWERRHAAAAVASERFDFEAAFMLAAPAARLPEDAGGSCRIGVEFRGPAGETSWAGVEVRVLEGEVLSCVARPAGRPDASACGPASAWLSALGDGELRDLDLGGSRRLAAEVVTAFSRELFPAGQVASAQSA